MKPFEPGWGSRRVSQRRVLTALAASLFSLLLLTGGAGCGNGPRVPSVSSPLDGPSGSGHWSPHVLQRSLPGLLVARAGEHPELDLVAPDGATALALWTPPAGESVALFDCDAARGRALVASYAPDAPDPGSPILLSPDGGVRRLDLPGQAWAAGAALLADGSVVCNSRTDSAGAIVTDLVWSEGSGGWRPVKLVGRLPKDPFFFSLAPMAGRQGVALMLYAPGALAPGHDEAIVLADWRHGTLIVRGEPFGEDGALTAAPMATVDTIVFARSYAKDDRLAVDLVEVAWAKGRHVERTLVRDGPQSSGHDSPVKLGVGPSGSTLVLGWRLDGESDPTAQDEARTHRLQRLDLTSGALTPLPLVVRSDESWQWIER
jgi:hypothetical protein